MQNKVQPYLFSVQPLSSHPELQAALGTILRSDPTIVATHSNDIGQILLTATPSIQQDVLAPKLIPSFGRLKAQTSSFEVRVAYSMRNQFQQTIHESEIRYITEKLPVIVPSLTAKPSLTQDIWQDIASLVVTDALPYLQTEPWVTMITSIIDTQHGILNISEKNGFPTGQHLTTETQPSTVAEVVIYETNARGTGRAVVRHFSGPPLSVGMKLMPAL